MVHWVSFGYLFQKDGEKGAVLEEANMLAAKKKVQFPEFGEHQIQIFCRIQSVTFSEAHFPICCEDQRGENNAANQIPK